MNIMNIINITVDGREVIIDRLPEQQARRMIAELRAADPHGMYQLRRDA